MPALQRDGAGDGQRPEVDAAQLLAQGVLGEPALAVWQLHRVRRKAQRRRRDHLQAIEGGSQEDPSADQVGPHDGMSWPVWQDMGYELVQVEERQNVLVPTMLGRVSAAMSSIRGAEGGGKSGGNAAAQAAGAAGRLLLRLRRPASADAASSAAASSAPAAAGYSAAPAAAAAAAPATAAPAAAGYHMYKDRPR
jgi:hypothetical protein